MSEIVMGTEIVLSLVTAGLLMAAGFRVWHTRETVPSRHLFVICSVTAGVVLFRSVTTILDHTIAPGSTELATLPIRFVLLGTAAYIATLSNGHHDGGAE